MIWYCHMDKWDYYEQWWMWNPILKWKKMLFEKRWSEQLGLCLSKEARWASRQISCESDTSLGFSFEPKLVVGGNICQSFHLISINVFLFSAYSVAQMEIQGVFYYLVWNSIDSSKDKIGRHTVCAYLAGRCHTVLSYVRSIYGLKILFSSFAA